MAMLTKRVSVRCARSLVYTHTEVMPDWVKTFTKLEYLHVEGTFGSSLSVLPNDMFDDMSALTFMHLGVHPGMQQLPSFAGLTSLKSLNLAVFPSLVALPSVDTLHSLERFVIAGLPLLDSMPDLTAIRNLKWFAVVDRGTWCCNGFYKPCNLSHSMCQVHQIWGTPAATCLDPNRSEKVPTAGTLELIAKFPFSVCAGEALVPGILEGPPTPETMAQCNGTLYRQCEVSGYPEAMCYSARLMGVACDPNPFPIEMRRRQIAKGVGDLCDPTAEAWLGCK
ncbi:hypothetical protein BBJ28_00009593 [Nothophytophthora sp. Chile5]|nr:hypothetical protein BBJ28_00009593 [Nothophytophthora sp. Chile5]